MPNTPRALIGRTGKLILLSLLAVDNAVLATDLNPPSPGISVATTAPAAAAFEKALYSHFGAAMRACIVPGTTTEANLGAFTLVGKVSPKGRLVRPEVDPDTAVSRCFAEQLSNIQLPIPPTEGATPEGFPVQVEMQVTP